MEKEVKIVRISQHGYRVWVEDAEEGTPIYKDAGICDMLKKLFKEAPVGVGIDDTGVFVQYKGFKKYLRVPPAFESSEELGKFIQKVIEDTKQFIQDIDGLLENEKVVFKANIPE